MESNPTHESQQDSVKLGNRKTACPHNYSLHDTKHEYNVTSKVFESFKDGARCLMNAEVRSHLKVLGIFLKYGRRSHKFEKIFCFKAHIFRSELVFKSSLLMKLSYYTNLDTKGVNTRFFFVKIDYFAQ